MHTRRVPPMRSCSRNLLPLFWKRLIVLFASCSDWCDTLINYNKVPPSQGKYLGHFTVQLIIVQTSTIGWTAGGMHVRCMSIYQKMIQRFGQQHSHLHIIPGFCGVLHRIRSSLPWRSTTTHIHVHSDLWQSENPFFSTEYRLFTRIHSSVCGQRLRSIKYNRPYPRIVYNKRGGLIKHCTMNHGAAFLEPLRSATRYAPDECHRHQMVHESAPATATMPNKNVSLMPKSIPNRESQHDVCTSCLAIKENCTVLMHEWCGCMCVD